MAYAHNQQVIHRDLKPSNVLLTEDNKPILVDFGLSKIISEQPLTIQGAILGTPPYMSPEQGAGTAVDARSDVYALGVIFYELTTGVLPFSGETPVGLILKHINEPPAPPRSINPDLPPAVEQVIQKALAKEPANRYPSAQELLKAVERLMLPPAPETPFLDETMLTSTDDGRCPYRGLQTFEAEHTQFFFGREALIEQLVGQIVNLSEAGRARGSRFLAVLGASGSGKSSLVRAGLLPALQAAPDSAKWPIVVLRPGSRPWEELTAQLAPVLYNTEMQLSAIRQLLDNLAVDSRALHLAVRLAWADDVATGEAITTLKRHTDAVTSVAFSPDGTKLASGAGDGLVHILDTKLAQHPCQWLTRNLSRVEWQQYVSPDLLYREVCPGLPVPGR